MLISKWAQKGYTSSITSPRTLSNVGLGAYLKDRCQSILFRVTLGFVDLAFWFNKVIGWWKSRADGGWEDRLQKQFEAMAKEEFGIEIDDTVFLG